MFTAVNIFIPDGSHSMSTFKSWTCRQCWMLQSCTMRQSRSSWFPLERWTSSFTRLQQISLGIQKSSTVFESFFLGTDASFSLQIPVLIHELILIEVWKHKVFPILCQLQDFNPKNSFQLYMVVSVQLGWSACGFQLKIYFLFSFFFFRSTMNPRS